jgi:glycosyltransferase involved in cell wall biosynthesis
MSDTADPTEHVFHQIAFIGNHTPRQCGIATFTADLSSSIQERSPERECIVVAMNDAGKHYAYPEQVRYQIPEESLASYQRAADFLNLSDVGLVSLQHEYGIYGGKAGAHLLALLRALRMPIVTTLHTILVDPNPSQRMVLDEICRISSRLVVMSTTGAELLERVHGIRPEKIDVIHHGISSLPDAAQSRRKLGLKEKRVLLTFGLLSPDKGIEYVIDALVPVVQRYPDVVYVVVGVTHPHVKERQGEGYRLMLESRGHRLGVADHMVFHDRFVTPAELGQFLAAADIYLTPYLNLEQIASGTLAYAVGSGKAVVSTRYRYAEELLADGRGTLVPAKNSDALANAILALFDDSRLKADVEQRAAALGRDMAWPVVADQYLASFERASKEHATRTRQTMNPVLSSVAALPELNLDHVRTLTDDTGILQHAVYSVPRYEDGYCLDDNARALLVLALVEEARIESPAAVRALTTRYLAFVRHAFDTRSGRFRNFMSFSRQWLESSGSEDSHGRALWALGTVVARSGDPGKRAIASELFESALPAVVSFTSPRAWAYTLLGIGERIQSDGVVEPLSRIARVLASRLLDLFRRSSDRGWPWCEDRVTYCNARIPQALMVSGAWMEDEEMITTGLTSLEWLTGLQTTPSGVFSPIGSNGFLLRNGPKADFDQQPVEACAMIAAYSQAFRITGKRLWQNRAREAFNWYLGQNQLEQWLYDAGTGGCRDGLHRERRNENQGAESTLSFLMALLDVRYSVRGSEPRFEAEPTSMN